MVAGDAPTEVQQSPISVRWHCEWKIVAENPYKIILKKSPSVHSDYTFMNTYW